MRALLLIGLAACTAGPGTFEVDGVVSGSAPPTGKVVFVWNTTLASYKWGDGTSTMASFTLTLDPSPPLSVFVPDSGIAVGTPMLIDNSETIGDGPIMLTSVARLGIATDYAVIYKDATAAGLGTSWDAALGASYSCVTCVRGGSGSKDSWQLTPCANVQIVVAAPDSDVCNWN